MPRKLLLADDSITIQKVVAITLASEDFAITAVDNGEDAVARARDLKPDIILADVVMPRKTGYEVCELVKSDPGLKHIPVLLLAGTFEAFDEGRARAASADGHIQKPFESQALIDKVNGLLGKGPARPVAAQPVAGVAAPQPMAAAPRPPGPVPPGPIPPGLRVSTGMPIPGVPRPPGPGPGG
ncbi:MAG: response regulator, partial [Deltaproteobacteria bacterium]|nr:response regulator [Deltaproteobacteria bacterium]